ncbi:MAG: NAD-dependent epimerase/dehydratase family protein [bacterium]
MRILILGGKGFLGRHMQEQAEARGYSVSSLDIADEKPFDVNGITPKDIDGFDHVYHFAALVGTDRGFEESVAVLETNTIGTLKVLEAARVAQVLMTFVGLNNTWLNPYSISKNAAMQLCSMYAENFGLSIHRAITYNVFGPYQPWQGIKRLIPQTMVNLIKSSPITLYGDGLQTVDLVYVVDVVNALLDNRASGIFHYGSGVARAVKDVVALCAEALSVPCPNILFQQKRLGEPEKSISLSPSAMELQTPIFESLQATASWYKKSIP